MSIWGRAFVCAATGFALGCQGDAVAPTPVAPAPRIAALDPYERENARDTATVDSVVVDSTASPFGLMEVTYTFEPLSDSLLYEPEDLTHPRILSLRPLVAAILAAYGSPESSLARARALRDWVARTAVTNTGDFHPDGSTANRVTLPSGKTWADVNAIAWMPGRPGEDAAFWWSVGSDGTEMLRVLLGDYDAAAGRWVGNGMMEPLGGARFRIRDLETYRYAACSFQVQMLVSLWAAAGLHGMLVQTIGHDGAAVYIPEWRRWVWQDPHYNEEYVDAGTGAPLSALGLFRRSIAAELATVAVAKRHGPLHDREMYIQPEQNVFSSYLGPAHPLGMAAIAVQFRNRQAGIPGWNTGTYQIESSMGQDIFPFSFTESRESETLFPRYGVIVDSVSNGLSATVRLRSTLPAHVRFETRLDGAAWRDLGDRPSVPRGVCMAEFRSVDRSGAVSAAAEVVRRSAQKGPCMGR